MFKNIILMLGLLFGVDYQTEIQPIFNSSCGNCHLGNSSGGLNLSNYNNLMSSGTVVPGDHMASVLYDRIIRPESAQGDMPPVGSLSQSDIDLIALWIDEGALPEESTDVVGCTDSNAITCEDEIDTVYFPECNTCSDDLPCDNYYSPDATVDNGSCMYNDVPSEDQFVIEYTNASFNLDWGAFIPPVSIEQYSLQRCVDLDGDGEYENCVMILPHTQGSLSTSYTDEYSLQENEAIYYTLYVGYPNNNYWGSANGKYYYEEDDSVECTAGDVNGDSITNVIDIVNLVNYILGSGSFDENQLCAADMNGDGIINVIDIVNLVNLILS